MAGTNLARHGGTAFDSFLYAHVGQDRNGNAVTVLSTLARLGFDPWDAASDLARLTRDAARTRLDGLLAPFEDVPTLGGNHGSTAQRLVDLLPAAAAGSDARSAPAAVAALGRGPIYVIAALLALLANAVFANWN